MSLRPASARLHMQFPNTGSCLMRRSTLKPLLSEASIASPSAPPISIPTLGWCLKPLACEFEAKLNAASHANPQDWVVFDEACEVAV